MSRGIAPHAGTRGARAARLSAIKQDIARNLDLPQRYAARVLRNSFTEHWHGREAELHRNVATERLRWRHAFEAGDGSVVMLDPGPTSVVAVLLDESSDPTSRVETFELDPIADVRWAVARVSDPSIAAQPLPVDAAKAGHLRAGRHPG